MLGEILSSVLFQSCFWKCYYTHNREIDAVSWEILGANLKFQCNEFLSKVTRCSILTPYNLTLAEKTYRLLFSNSKMPHRSYIHRQAVTYLQCFGKLLLNKR